jgi:HEAT repeat protein
MSQRVAGSVTATAGAERDPGFVVRKEGVPALSAERRELLAGAIRRTLHDESEGVRGHGLAAAVWLDDSGLATDLIGSLQEPTVDLAVRAGIALLGPGTNRGLSDAHADALRATMQKNAGTRRSLAACVLLASGRERSERVTEAVIEAATGDTSAMVRENAIVTLARAEVGGQATVAALATSLREDQAGPVRAMAAYALGEVGKGDAAAIEALRLAQDDADADVREHAAAALLALGEH